ncbi:hypothetical protein ABMJ51_002859 [Escherichia coli]|uniref:hypothetical protein n=1 Tax=Escherichia coli TaxID=562 RepID=UPI0006A12611|nr:hypothetical protein [Escherichia coli]CTT72309.1 Uncharacterised protein [Escherichia coli]
MEVLFAEYIDYTGFKRKTPHDYETIAIKRCGELGLIYHGFVMPWKGQYTHVYVTCKKHNTSRTIVFKSLKKQGACIECYRDSLKLPKKNNRDEETILTKASNVLERKEMVLVGLLEEYKGLDTKASYKCTCCNTTYETIITRIINNDAGCRHCGSIKRGINKRKHTDDEWLGLIEDGCKEKRLKLIKRPKSPILAMSKLKLKCEKGHISDTIVAYGLVYENDGCPCCSKSGYNKSKPGVFYVQQVGDYIKYGITNHLNPQKRITQQSRESGLSHKLLWYITFGDGKVANDLEYSVKHNIGSHAAPKELIPDGYTETCDITKEAQIRKMAMDFCKNSNNYKITYRG